MAAFVFGAPLIDFAGVGDDWLSGYWQSRRHTTSPVIGLAVGVLETIHQKPNAQCHVSTLCKDGINSRVGRGEFVQYRYQPAGTQIITHLPH